MNNMMLSPEDYARKMAIPDLTERFENFPLFLNGDYEACYSGDEYNGHTAWNRALDHADRDHISFCVVKYCQNYYVLDKHVFMKLMKVWA